MVKGRRSSKGIEGIKEEYGRSQARADSSFKIKGLRCSVGAASTTHTQEPTNL